MATGELLKAVDRVKKLKVRLKKAEKELLKMKSKKPGRRGRPPKNKKKSAYKRTMRPSQKSSAKQKKLNKQPVKRGPGRPKKKK